MNTLSNNFKDVKKASSVKVALEANLKAQQALLETKRKTGNVIQLRDFYSMLIEEAMDNPSIVKATIKRFSKQEQAA